MYKVSNFLLFAFFLVFPLVRYRSLRRLAADRFQREVEGLYRRPVVVP